MGRSDVRRAMTIRDVASAAGVSVATAGRALGGYGPVREATREQVRLAAERLGYRANTLARSMITGTTNTLALVVADIENPFFARSSRGFTDTARAAGFEVIVANTDEDIGVERSVVKVMIEKRVDGLVIAPASRLDRDHLAAAHATGVQIVLLDRHIPGLPVDSVVVDNRRAADTAVSHAIERGHRRIAIVTSATPDGLGRPSMSRTLSTGRERLDGYTAALRRAGLTPQPQYVKLGDFRREAAYQMTCELLELTEPPTAIFSTDAMISLGVFEALQGAGVAVPGEMSIVAFDDTEWATVVRPQLTVVAQPVYELGALAAQRVIARVRGDETRPRRHQLRTSLVVRESVARLRPPDQAP